MKRLFLHLLLLLLISFLGLAFPDFFAPLKDLIVPLLALIMTAMGLTLSWDDFLRVFKKPYKILYGSFLQFSIMPVTGYILGAVFSLSTPLTVGTVLVGSAPGGTASNLITFLAKGDVAYSVSMTSFSTLVSPLLTPLWTYLLVGRMVEVPFWNMALFTLKIVVLPVIVGMIIKNLLKIDTRKVEDLLSLLAVIFIALIIAIIFALSKEDLKGVGFSLLAVVIIHNLLGYLFGFAFGKVVGLSEKEIRALSIEVGLQNSGLSTVLALKFFSPVSALPSAIFSVVQNLTGLILAGFFSTAKGRREA